MGFEWRSKIKFKSKTIILITRHVAREGPPVTCRPAEPSKIVEKVTKNDPIFQKFACGGHFDTHKLELTCNSSATGPYFSKKSPAAGILILILILSNIVVVLATTCKQKLVATTRHKCSLYHHKYTVINPFQV